MAFSLGEYQDIFLEEADDQLQELNKNLLEMEQNPDDEDTINNIFRAAHSLKSSAAFVGLNDLSELAHKMENLLQGVRDKTMQITPEIIDLLFKCFDYINSVIDLVSRGEEPDVDLSGIIAEIKDIHDTAADSAPQNTEDEAQTQSDDADLQKVAFSANEKRHLKRGMEDNLICYELAIYIEPDAPMKWVKAQLVLNNLKNIAQIVKTVPDEENLTDEQIKDLLRVIILTDEELEDVRGACDVDLVTRIDVLRISLVRKDDKYVLRYGERETISETETEEVQPEAVRSVPEVQVQVQVVDERSPVEVIEDEEVTAQKTSKTITSRAGSPSLRTVKVSVDKLDDLLNNVGELVIANSGFFRMYEDLKKLKLGKKIGNDFKNRIEIMARIAKDLQSGIMKTRMVPIGQVFSRFHRLTRDLSKETGKNIQLVTKGEDTELDKKVIDVIGEPLMHMIRNSVDHAIETPEERARLKKSEVGTITLNAHQGGNQIFVEVTDDGRGLDVDQIKKKAVERKLSSPEQISTMEENEIYNFIFHPGFSTAKKVTDVSGRGVGMNVVKEVVEEMGGSIHIESEQGMGTKFIMAFPLTLAIIPAIMVKVATETYAIPLTDVIETVNIDKKDITTIEGHEVINLRGEILSLVRLNNFVGIRSRIVNEQDIPVIVVGYSNRKIGLIVDELEGKLEIVIKSLENNYKTVEGLAGASILGDGSIALILDIGSMINKVITEQERLSHEEKLELIRKQEEQFDEVEEENRQYAELTQTREELDEGSIEISEVEESVETYEDIYRLKESEKVEELPKAEEVPAQETKALEEPAAEEETTQIPEEDEVVEEVSENEAEAEDDTDLLDVDEQLQITEEVEEFQTEEEPEPVDDQESTEETQIETIDIDDEEENDLEIDAIEEDESSHAAEDITDMLEPVAQDEAPDQRVHEALTSFKEELQQNIKSTMQDSDPDGHIKKVLELKEDDLDKIKLLSNVGITQAADSLSKIIGTRIDMAIPDVRLLPAEKIPSVISHEEKNLMTVSMKIVGDMNGSVLFSLPETSGYQLIDDLYNLESGATRELNEDGTSALKEITNIVGASVINAISERTGLSILTEVPTFYHGDIETAMGALLETYDIKKDYALTMDTEFYYEDDRVMGHLLVLPKTSSLRRLVDNLRDNG